MRRRGTSRGLRGLVLAVATSASLAVVAAGQTPPPAGVALPYPDGCVAFGLSEARCAHVTRWAAEQTNSDPTTATFELLGDPMLDSPRCSGATTCMTNRTQAFVVRVRVLDADGSAAEASVFCGIGSEASYLCTETPLVARHSPTMDGYWDVPCSDEDGQACATPIPTARPSGITAAAPLRLPRLEIPIDHVGGYVVAMGEATLPNGILSEASFDLGPTTPAELLVAEHGVTLTVESLAGGPPFENAYEHGWRRGVERVHVALEFDVDEFAPGATLEVLGLVVR